LDIWVKNLFFLHGGLRLVLRPMVVHSTVHRGFQVCWLHRSLSPRMVPKWWPTELISSSSYHWVLARPEDRNILHTLDGITYLGLLRKPWFLLQAHQVGLQAIWRVNGACGDLSLSCVASHI
jgi:hypothetical protein